VSADLPDIGSAVYRELWVSLASLLRSYTAAHGLNGNRQATVELGEERILVRHGESWLDLEREGSKVNWKQSDGRSGKFELTESGGLRGDAVDLNGPYEFVDEEMDMVAERWARELMQ
jgi:hypothetical protein